MKCSTPMCFAQVRGWTNLKHEGKPEVCIVLCVSCSYQAAKMGTQVHQLKEATK